MWTVYEEIGDISRLLQWFDPDESCDRSLTYIIRRLFPGTQASQGPPVVGSASFAALNKEDKAILDNVVLDYHNTITTVSTPVVEGDTQEVSSPAKRRGRQDDEVADDNTSSQPPAKSAKRTESSSVSSMALAHPESSRAQYESLPEGTKVTLADNQWSGKIVESKIDSSDCLFYKVRIDGWGRPYDAWYSEFDVTKQSLAQSTSKGSGYDSDDSDMGSVDFTEYEGIEYVKTLGAIYYLHERDRNRGIRPAPMILSKYKTHLEILKLALLTVEAALPLGALDEDSEDRWGDDFITTWRERYNHGPSTI